MVKIWFFVQCAFENHVNIVTVLNKLNLIKAGTEYLVCATLIFILSFLDVKAKIRPVFFDDRTRSVQDTSKEREAGDKFTITATLL